MTRLYKRPRVLKKSDLLRSSLNPSAVMARKPFILWNFSTIIMSAMKVLMLFLYDALGRLRGAGVAIKVL